MKRQESIYAKEVGGAVKYIMVRTLDESCWSLLTVRMVTDEVTSLLADHFYPTVVSTYEAKRGRLEWAGVKIEKCWCV